jgi:hypothetical protein
MVVILLCLYKFLFSYYSYVSIVSTAAITVENLAPSKYCDAILRPDIPVNSYDIRHTYGILCLDTAI